MPTPSTRLLTLIMLLQKRPNQKAADLAQQLGVSVRTLHRYFAMLDEMGIPIYSERGPQGGFSLVRGYRMPPLILTPEEAVAVYLGAGLVEEMWGRLFGEAARAALAKIENVLPDEQRNEVAWARRALLATGMHRVDFSSLAPNLDRLRRAVHERRMVKMTYQAREHPEPEQREVEPYALIHRWGWWYMIGYCRLRGAVRSFRLDRMGSLSLLDKTFELPAGFDIQSYLAEEPLPKPTYPVRMRFSPEAASFVRVDPIFWQGVEEVGDGSLFASFCAHSREEAAAIALACGPQAEVLEPEELRCLLRMQAAAFLNLYPPSVEKQP
jgi:predicted DNA-binding transcriptional regulator YafY